MNTELDRPTDPACATEAPSSDDRANVDEAVGGSEPITWSDNDSGHGVGVEEAPVEQADERPGGWLILFDLPYFVSVPDSMDDPDLRAYAEAVGAGEDPEPVPYSPRPRPGGLFTIGGGPPIHLPDPAELGAPFEVPHESGAVRIEFLRRIRNVDRAMVMLGEMRPDRGAASFTSVRAHFDTALSRTIGINDLKQVANTAVGAVNAFLEQYRYFASAYWAQPIEMADVIEFLIWRLFDDGRKSGPAVHSSPGGGPLVMSGSQPLIDAAKEQAIRARLAAGEESPFAYEVMLFAEEHVHRNRYRNAVVDSATAFEIFLAGFLRFHLADQGRSEQEIEAVLHDAGGGYLEVKTLAKDVLRSELGVDFASTAEYRDWTKNVLDLRNKVVHGAIGRPTREAALLSIRDAEGAQAKLQDLSPTTTKPATTTSPIPEAQ